MEKMNEVMHGQMSKAMYELGYYKNSCRVLEDELKMTLSIVNSLKREIPMINSQH